MSNKTKPAQKKPSRAKSAPDIPREESSDKIERIRDLILGPHLRDISQQFAAVSKDLGRLEGDLTRIT